MTRDEWNSHITLIDVQITEANDMISKLFKELENELRDMSFDPSRANSVKKYYIANIRKQTCRIRELEYQKPPYLILRNDGILERICVSQPVK